MLCPKCGFVLDDFTVECPRCARMRERGEEPPEISAPLPVQLPLERPVQVSVEQPVRRERLPWLTIWLIAAGLCVLALTAAVAISGLYFTTHRPETRPPVSSSPLVSSPTPTGAPPRAKDIARVALPSVVMVLVGDGGSPNKLGSGFFVRDGVVATNYHVIENGERMQLKLTGSTSLAVLRVLAVDQQYDLALLQTDTGYASPLKLGDSDQLSVGDVVYAVGNPQGLEGTFSQGIVSALARGQEHLLQVSAPISHGSSGGPVLDAYGNVIGVAVAYYEGGQNLNFAIPVKQLMVLLRKAGM